MNRIRQFLDHLTHEQLVDRLDLALEGANLGIWDWDLTDDSVQFDRRWCAMLGLDHGQIAMSLDTWSDLVHPDDIEQCFVDIKAHIAGETPFYENVHRMKHADGHWVWILDRGRVSGRDDDGNPTRMTGTHFDVTVTEQARRLLEHRRDEMARFVENMPASACMVDTEMRYLAASRQWLSTFGLRDQDILGRSHYDIFPEIPEHWKRLHRRGLAGEQLSNDEDRFERDDGSVQWIRWAIHPWRRTDESIGGLIMIADDITELVEQRMRRESDSRLASLAVIAGGTAHELNTPLHVIGLEAGLLQSDLDTDLFDPDDATTSIAAIVDAVARAREIVDTMRTLARDPAEVADTERGDAATSLSALIDGAASLLRGLASSRGIELQVDLGAQVETAASRSEIQQILTNLVTNAIDSISDRPVRDAPSERWIRLEIDRAADRAVIRCIDSGPGMPDDVAARAMEPFFTTKDVGRGTGLGLALSNVLAVRNGGTLRLARPRAATTFELSLPALEPS